MSNNLDDYIIQCCVCKRIKIGNDWVKSEINLSNKIITHGYCFDCYEKVIEDMMKGKKLCNDCEIKDACFSYRKDEICILKEKPVKKQNTDI